MQFSHLQRKIDRRDISSQYLQKKFSLKIYLPPEQKKITAYPTLYLQDGDDYFTLGRVATIANALIIKGEIMPLIIVGIPMEKRVRTSHYAPSGEHSQNYRRFVHHELVPLIDANYPTLPFAKNRAIGGSSLGGTQALSIALQYPEQFQLVLSQSGAFDQLLVNEIQQKIRLQGLICYQMIGDEEDQAKTPLGVRDFLTWNRQVRRLLEEKGATVYYREKEGNHTWGLWQGDLPEALGKLFPPLETDK